MVAHLHYVLIGINVFPVGRRRLFLVSKNDRPVCSMSNWGAGISGPCSLDSIWRFLPMHLTGLLGMPRRIYTYADYGGWGILNLITTIGSFVFAAGVLLLFINVLRSLKRGTLAGKNPWDAPTLEWSVPSPPPAYNFAVIPTVASRHPLWEGRIGSEGTLSSIDRGMMLDHGKETIGTSALDAQPDMVLEMPGDSIAPLLLAIGLSALFVGLLLKVWVLAGVGGAIALLAVLVWLWPRTDLREREPRMAEAVIASPVNLPVGPLRRHGIGWWGAGTLVASEGALFAYLLFAYYYTGASSPRGMGAGNVSAAETRAAEYPFAVAVEPDGVVGASKASSKRREHRPWWASPAPW